MHIWDDVWTDRLSNETELHIPVVKLGIRGKINQRQWVRTGESMNEKIAA